MTSGELERTLKSLPVCPATFKEPMECLAVPKLPDGTNWLFEIKLDGYARVRNGFVPDSRRQIFGRLKPLLIPKCPFANLPETHKGRWGEGLTAADMDKCVWVRPEIVARIEFLEWTASDHLRHSKFAGLRDDKDPRNVIKEHGSEG
jgi:ATP-dependent DNA ligase